MVMPRSFEGKKKHFLHPFPCSVYSATQTSLVCWERCGEMQAQPNVPHSLKKKRNSVLPTRKRSRNFVKPRHRWMPLLVQAIIWFSRLNSRSIVELALLNLFHGSIRLKKRSRRLTAVSRTTTPRIIHRIPFIGTHKRMSPREGRMLTTARTKTSTLLTDPVACCRPVQRAGRTLSAPTLPDLPAHKPLILLIHLKVEVRKAINTPLSVAILTVPVTRRTDFTSILESKNKHVSTVEYVSSTIVYSPNIYSLSSSSSSSLSSESPAGETLNGTLYS